MPSKRNVSYHAYAASSPMNRHKIAEFDRLLPVWRRGLAYAMGVWSRMIELERSGHVCRVDREGVNSRHRHCWRWNLTEDGYDSVRELLGETETM